MSEHLYCVSTTIVRYGAARQPFVELSENGRLVARVPAGTFAAMARRGPVSYTHLTLPTILRV